MSVKVSAWVWEHSEARGSDRLVLLAFADYAHDDGGAAFPSIPHLARKARVSRSTALRCVKSLLAAARLEHTGTTPRGTKVYRVLMTEGCQIDTGQIDTGGSNAIDGGVTGDTRLSIGEPSKEPSTKKKGRRSQKNGDRFKPDPDSEEDVVIEAIFDAWHSGAGQNGNSYLTISRAGQIRRRLGEIHDADPSATLLDARNQLLDAVKGLLTSKWHVEKGEIGFPLIFRNRERVDFCLERLAKTEAEAPDAAERFAKYDAVIQNPDA